MDLGERLGEVLTQLRVHLDDRLAPNSAREARERVELTTELRAVAEALHLQAVADLDVRPGAVAGAKTGKVALTHLKALNLGHAQAARDVAAARAVRDQLPEMGTALGAGVISRGHVDVAVKAVGRLPSSMRAAAPVVDEFCTRLSLDEPPSTVDLLAKRLIAGIDPDAADRFDPAAHERRFLEMSYSEHGLSGSFQMFGAQAVRFFAVLKHYAVPHAEDDRSTGQRLLDALAHLVDEGATHAGTTQGAEPAHVMVTVTPDQLAARQGAGEPDCPTTGTAVPDEVFRQLLCDSLLQTIVTGQHGEVLHLGREQRLASKAQRRALAVRDRGCIVPGCGAPPSWCQAHHVAWWSSGGPTDIENLALLCTHHHTLVHRGTIQLKIIDDLPHVLDDHQQPRRNTTHRDLQAAFRLGRTALPSADPPTAEIGSARLPAVPQWRDANEEDG